MKKLWNKIRLWLVKILLTKSERYLINRAIHDRIEYLDRYKIEDKTANYEDCVADIKELKEITWWIKTGRDW